ncbi:MAG: hypothetical protein ACE5HV_00150 [Acidobacteriota bacterium]
MDERLSLAIRTKNILSAFERTEAWEFLKATIEANIQNKINAVVDTPLANMSEAGAQEYVKGEISAFKWLLNLPASQLEDAQSVIDACKEQEDGTKAESAAD